MSLVMEGFATAIPATAVVTDTADRGVTETSAESGGEGEGQLPGVNIPSDIVSDVPNKL
jgi:hypothetical protein